jgi:hypothetical protein
MADNTGISVEKSDRHSKIAGDFFESLVLYLLSKHGFECALVDHTGIDIIARNTKGIKGKKGEYLGISVKGRTRKDGQKAGRVKVTDYEDHKGKIEKACRDFGDAKPYLAVVVDAEGEFTGVLTPLEHMEDKYMSDSKNLNFSMTKDSVEKYRKDRNVAVFNFSQGEGAWWEANSATVVEAD